MLAYPAFNPIALSLGSVKIHWYGLTYLLGFLGAWLAGIQRIKKQHLDWTREAFFDLLFYVALGVVIGGRAGYMLFYSQGRWFTQPFSIIRIWEGGMSFHGGLLGVMVAVLIYAKRTRREFFAITDFVTPLIPIGLFTGRIGNFINGELWGKVTEAPWAMVFPTADLLPRHPTQLYECFFEGLVLFAILWCYSSIPRVIGKVSGLFAILYGIFRFIIEFFREPDPQLGYLAWDWLTMGQLLSIPVLLLGVYLLFRPGPKDLSGLK